MPYIIIFLISAFFLMGCNSTQHQKPPAIPSPLTLANTKLFTPVPVPSENDIFSLPDSEKATFLLYYNQYLEQDIRADKAIYQYLEKYVSNFTYDGETFTAIETLKNKKGNCISLAILTQALAKIVNVETSFREVSTYPIYKKEQDLLLVSSHFSTKLFAPGQEEDKNWIQAIRAGTVVDYFPEQSTFYLGNAKYPKLVAKFYVNLSTQALIKEDLNLSYSLARAAFQFTPHNPELINLLAIIHRRAGDTNTAKKLFEFAIQHNLLSSNLIASYSFLAKTLNDPKLEHQLEEKLEQVAKTPFDYLTIAQKATAKKQYRKSKKILKTIIEHYPYLPEPYFELAKVHYLQNHQDLARDALEHAITKSDSQEKTGMYEAKLKSLELTLH